MSLILTNREKQKIKVDIGSIVNYNQEDIDYFNTITEIKLKNGHILEVLETEEQIEKMIYQYHNSNGEKKMRETWDKPKNDFIELTRKRNNKKIIVNKKHIETIFVNKQNVVTVSFALPNVVAENSFDAHNIDVLETYQEIKELLGL